MAFWADHPFLALILIVIVYLAVRSLFKRLFSKKISDFPRKYPDDVRSLLVAAVACSSGLQVYDEDTPEDFYHVAIVGAGPAGSTCGYFLGKAGKRTLLLEKKKFPRDKHCGDAVCKTGIELLHEMGIFQQLIDENKARVADSGGMVSPSGFSFIGQSKELLGQIPAAIACKRILLDEAIAKAAARAGADLKEECPVEDAVFDASTGLWTIKLEGSTQTFKSRVLVCADGATSQLATKLGLVKDPPCSNCTRSYVKAGTHKFKADGVVFYNRDMLPGYSALFRHPNDELNYCVYIIPGNPKVTPDDLTYWHEFLKSKDPNMSKALGPNIDIERMKAGSLRLGGEAVTYGEHVIVIGDAAGMIDPMTGEGIHHAMEAGKLSAQFLEKAIKQGNYSRDLMSIFQDIWMDKFGSDFKWSWLMCKLLYRFPILIDAATMAVIRKGDDFLMKWADIMTGRVPKLSLLKPEFSIVITYELILLIIKRMLGRASNDACSKKEL